MTFPGMSAGPHLDRPDAPLIVKCVFDKSLRRITFASALTCRLETLRARIEDCFALGASSFFVAYTDDDGEETSIRSESDLTEAISYFDTGGDDDFSAPAASSASTYSSDVPILSRSKVTLRVQVVVEYDGPSLSDTASIAETFDDRLIHGDTYDDGSESSWQSESSREIVDDRRYRRRSYRDELVIPEEDEDNLTDSDFGKPPRLQKQGPAHQSSPYADSTEHTDARKTSEEPLRRRSSSRNQDQEDGSQRMSLAARPHSRSDEWQDQSPPAPSHEMDSLRLDTRVSSNRGNASPAASIRVARTNIGPPSILTSSELGARWLREQNERLKKRVGPGSSSGGSRSSGLSMEEDLASDDDEASMYEEGRGDLALVRDRRGKWYYSYQTSDLASNAETEPDYPPVNGSNRSQHSSATPTYQDVRKTGKQAETFAESDTYDDPDHTSLLASEAGPEEDEEVVDTEEPAAPPFFAPDCSACGLRLDYMRYVCGICGEGHMWQEGQQEKQIVLEAQLNGVHGSDGASSGEAEWGRAAIEARSHSSGASSATVNDNDLIANRAENLTVENSLLEGPDATSSTPEPSPPNTPVDDTDSRSPFRDPRHSSKLPHKAPHGYELCAGCIEIQGTAHARAMGAMDLDVMQGGSGKADGSTTASSGLSRRLGAMRHTFRELIWSAKGWKDIEYNDECRCSICNLELYQNRHKCVSCANFNLCRSCHQNAQEIHPAHCFLTVPDQTKRLKHAADRARNSRKEQVSKLVKHPGAFCHNCLQDIMGPRFHCAVCPSWDLCIQCEGLASTASGVGGTHTADHIMMKIPLPLASSEVEFVSRRARDRWTQRDFTAVSGGIETPITRTPARSPSPTNETVYGGGGQVASGRTTANVMVRDSLDHGVQCRGCNEWIMGRRYQCANCPSEPVPYNLCSLCELRSYKIHNPMHVFIKFDRPVHYPLQSPFPVLPPLYKIPVGQVRSVAPLDPRDATAYLKCVQHTSTICDIHVGPIQGIWLRCAQCAVSFDICQECESAADHDPTHVFVVFKSEVDMPTFRALAGLSATHSRPLIHQHIYL